VVVYICFSFENLKSAPLNLAFCGWATKIGAQAKNI